MDILKIITKKKNNQKLTKKEIDYAFLGYLNGEIPDYQMSSLLMAICINGMDKDETINLTNLFINSGDTLDLSEIEGIKVDKHSTGGVGDKVTLIIGPIVASLGVKVPKMSGRGLGITGGTIDKLESIPGFKTNLSEKEFIKQVNEVGFAVTSQTKNLVPMDKEIYTLRDVSGTTESLPLIAASIMSKKIASGADKMVIDIKVGKGALIKTKKEANELATLMKEIGEIYNKEVRTIITNMNAPLGYNIGNSLEILEVIEVLQGKENNTYLAEICFDIAAHMVSMGLNISYKEATVLVEQSINDKSAYNKFLEFVKAQNGDLKRLSVNIKRFDILAPETGFVKNINALSLGELGLKLGTGRRTKNDKIDHSVGIVLHKQVGDLVNEKDKLMTLYCKQDVNSIILKNYFEIEEII